MTVVPAKAGTHFDLRAALKIKMDSGLRRNERTVEPIGEVDTTIRATR